MRDLPSGTVTLLFTDIEGSTRMLHELGDAYAALLAEHRRALRDAFVRHRGVEVDTQGDGFFVAFAGAKDALEAAADAQRALAEGRVRVRMGIHTGEPLTTDEGYVGVDVHRAARIMSAGHGGQVIVSETTQRLVGARYPLHDLGLHRLKDLTAPERLFQLGDGEFPPLKTLNQTNLPVAEGPLLGRDAEVTEVLALLRDGARVVTVTGAGGCGKTRLALQVAAELVGEFPDGVFWIPLAGLRDSELVVPSVAQTLGVRDNLARHLAERKALLLFDNFEHLLDAAAPVAELLSAAPELRALVTSRAALRIAGEVEVPLDSLGEEDAMTLFLERARVAGRTLERDRTVREICRRLDRLPLALELAAARARLLDGEALLARLDKRLPLLVGGRRDVPTRQRTLRATIEWSHELLEPNAQNVFARLAVFVGSFSLGAAEAVCDAELEIVATLVDGSLLKPIAGDRFLMLETIREYAVERLEELGDADDLRRLHAFHYLELAEAARPHLRGPDLGAWLDRLAEEHDNFRSALDSFERSGEADAALQMAVALFRFWFIRGYPDEARKRLKYALAAASGPTPTRADALDSAATLALDEADPTTARRYAEQSLALHRELGDTAGIARSLVRLAQAAADDGGLAQGRSLAEEGVRLFLEIGDVDSLRSATHELGWMTFADGDVEQAREILEENLLRARGAGDRSVEAASLELLSMIAVAEGRADDARALLAESYRINRDLGFSFGIAFDLDYLAAAAASESRLLLAVRLLSRAEALRTEVGIRVRGLDATINERTLGMLRADLDEESFHAAWAEGRELNVDEAVRLSTRSPKGD